MVDIIKVFGGISASNIFQHFSASRMILEEIGHIIDCIAGSVPDDESVRSGMKQNDNY